MKKKLIHILCSYFNIHLHKKEINFYIRRSGTDVCQTICEDCKKILEDQRYQ